MGASKYIMGVLQKAYYTFIQILKADTNHVNLYSIDQIDKGETSPQTLGLHINKNIVQKHRGGHANNG